LTRDLARTEVPFAMMSSMAELRSKVIPARGAGAVDRAAIRQDRLNRNNPEKAGRVECLHNVRALGTARKSL
jgi:hypothetical protein